MRAVSVLAALGLALALVAPRPALAAVRRSHRDAPVPGEAPIAVWPQADTSLAQPGKTKLVTFVFDPNDTYTILCLPGAVTDIDLRPSERVLALALGDSVQWQAEKRGSHLFLRPLRGGLFTSATLVTSERTYEMTLYSAGPGGTWYQRVNWRYPNLVVIERSQAALALAEGQGKAKQARAHVDVGPAPQGIPVARLNFNYTVTGEAPFRPTQVFDDGTFTYIRFGHKPQEMPALFVETPDGRDELAVYNFEPSDSANPSRALIKVQRLFNRAVLKLGGEEVRIVRNR